MREKRRIGNILRTKNVDKSKIYYKFYAKNCEHFSW